MGLALTISLACCGVVQVQNMATKSGDSDDLVATAFKKQQKQYQDLMKGLQVCICQNVFPVMVQIL